MLVEGGPTLLRSFLEQRMADEITIYVSTPFAERRGECANARFPRPARPHEASGWRRHAAAPGARA
jgi:riboflavin biosynthesis pyrimidine reductase